VIGLSLGFRVWFAGFTVRGLGFVSGFTGFSGFSGFAQHLWFGTDLYIYTKLLTIHIGTPQTSNNQAATLQVLLTCHMVPVDRSG
jgi:hypothetical protein